MARGPQFLIEYATELKTLGPAAFNVQYRGSVLVGCGMSAKVVERPFRWRRRTLGAVDLEQLAPIASIVDRVWRVRKDPGAQRGGNITAGQGGDNDIVLPEYTVSTQHCAFLFDASGMSIMDMGSLNGTKIDGVLIEPLVGVRLKDKAVVTLGRLCLEYLMNPSFIEIVKAISLRAG
ncbi:MAG: FHA domain-containing protein [Myxococcales bacterium]|nr:FHA domain-containing protein [Myxococcales bacterium]